MVQCFCCLEEKPVLCKAQLVAIISWVITIGAVLVSLFV